MKTALLAVLLACAPVVVAALSCMPHSVEATYQAAQDSAQRYVVVQGQLDFDAGQLPKKRGKLDNDAKTVVLRGRLTGASLSAAGFVTPYAKPVRVTLACFGPWCGAVTSGAQVLAFVEQGAGGPMVTVTPCGGDLFERPTRQMLRAVQQCFSGGACARLR